MRGDILLGLALTAASVLSLISYDAGVTLPPSGGRDAYALAITTGSGLRLAGPGGRSPGAPVADAPGAAQRILSCDSVMQLGVIDIGYSCSAPVQAAATGSL